EPWIRKSFWKDKKGPGYRLSTAMTSKTVVSLCDEEHFFFAHQVDSRGRIYPVTGWLSPQGEDLARGLLEFGEPKPLTDEGVRYLAIHGSQMVPREILLRDLGISDRALPTLDERIRWITEHAQEITESAQDPLAKTWWRDVAATNPFQFLAFCFAWSDYVEVGPTAECALPIQHDGTCNGLQHIAALTRDNDLAGATNLLPGQPRDIYIEVAQWVKERISLDAMEEPLASFVQGFGEFVNREMAKKVVMTIPYGAGHDTHAKSIATFLKDTADNDENPRSAPLRNLFERNELALRLNPNRSEALADAIETKRLRQGKRRKRCISGKDDPIWIVAQYLAVLFGKTMATTYPSIGHFKRWLSKTVLPIVERDLPVMWIAPSGLPVLQRNFKLDSVEKETKLYGRLRFSVLKTTDNVAQRSQLTGILPNFIHTLDSVHLVKTVLCAKKKGVSCFSMVHDSFGSHAADMPTLAQCLRETFIELYREDILARFSKWIDAVAFAADHRAEVLLAQELGGYEPAAGEQYLLELVSRWSLILATQHDADAKHEASTKSRNKVPSVPCGDGFDIQKVGESEYFFH
ncbi:MAG: hypothetical protein MN733_42340, partial [Nitrososphaera sp.]|nr:hypothetical protein [Nitrososphaera sp.]